MHESIYKIQGLVLVTNDDNTVDAYLNPNDTELMNTLEMDNYIEYLENRIEENLEDIETIKKGLKAINRTAILLYSGVSLSTINYFLSNGRLPYFLLFILGLIGTSKYQVMKNECYDKGYKTIRELVVQIAIIKDRIEEISKMDVYTEATIPSNRIIELRQDLCILNHDFWLLKKYVEEFSADNAIEIMGCMSRKAYYDFMDFDEETIKFYDYFFDNPIRPKERLLFRK